VNYTDIWLTGHFFSGQEYLPAVSLASYTLWLVTSLFATLAIGATALTARFAGAGDLPLASRVLNQALTVGLAASLVIAAAVYFGADGFAAIMQLRGESAELAAQFLRIVSIGVPAIMAEQIGIACLQGVGDTTAGYVARVVVVIVNGVLSTSLVAGITPLGDIGFRGLAIGTTTGYFLGAGVILGMLLVGRAGLKLNFRDLLPDPDLILRILRIGIPGGADVLTVVLCHMTYLSIIMRQGKLDTGAHQLGVVIESLAYLPGSAFQVAAATLTGQFLGAGKPERAQQAALTACAAGTIFMTVAGTIMYFAGGTLARFFAGQGHEEVATMTSDLLQIVAWTMPSLAVTMILTGSLRGAGDTSSTLVITLIGFFVMRIPGAIYLACHEIPIPFTEIVIPGWGLGVVGAWYAMLADVLLRSVLTALQFLRGKWKEVQV
jgi:putative MATE family efflux protein